MRRCTIDDCSRKHYARGWCHRHYGSWLRSGNPIPRPGGRAWRMGLEFGVPKASRPATVRDIEWAAGFVEGEGSFHGKPGNGAQMSVAQKDREPLERLAAAFGGTIYGPYEKQGWMHYWTVSGVRARGVMMTLYSLLSARRQDQIRAALSEGDVPEPVLVEA